jgi:hypothetical protein
VVVVGCSRGFVNCFHHGINGRYDNDNTYTQQETGKIQPQGGNFVWDFCVSPIHRGLKDAATHVEEFLKAWTVQVEP